MWNTFKKILTSAGSIIDITGSQSRERYNKISKDFPLNGFKNDKQRIWYVQ